VFLYFPYSAYLLLTRARRCRNLPSASWSIFLSQWGGRRFFGTTNSPALVSG
jgi:hypothetical protein